MKHVVSLELAKQLKEAGYEQEAEFKSCGGHTMYFDDEDGKFEACENDALLDSDEYCHTAGLVCEFTIARPLATELLERMPLKLEKSPTYVVIDRIETGGYEVYYEPRNDNWPFYKNPSLPDALAEMWLWLKREGHL